MNDDAEHIPSAFEERLRRLESQNRSLRRMALLTMAGIAIAMTLLIRWVVVRNDGRARFDKVEAEHFVVRDSLGEVRGELGMWSGIVRLTLGEDDRRFRGIAIGTGPSIGSQIVLRHGEGGPGLSLTDRSIGFEERFAEPGPRASFSLHRGVPSAIVVDSSGRLLLRDSLRLRR